MKKETLEKKELFFMIFPEAMKGHAFRAFLGEDISVGAEYIVDRTDRNHRKVRITGDHSKVNLRFHYITHELGEESLTSLMSERKIVDSKCFFFSFLVLAASLSHRIFSRLFSYW